MRWVLVFVVATGCGRIGFDGLASDGAPAESASPDVSELGPWSPPMVVSDISMGDRDDDPTLTADMLEIYFGSYRPGGAGFSDLWMATRASTSEPFGTPINLVGLNSPQDDTTPEVSPDGLTLYFASERPGGPGDKDVYVATRASRASAWGPPALVPELNTSAEESAVVVSADGLSLVMDSQRDGMKSIYTATRASTSEPWSTPVRLAELDGVGGLESPFLEASGLVLWLSVDVPGGDVEIYIATRTSLGALFATPVPVPELNSPNVDEDPWLSPDGRTLYFASWRSNNTSQIYMVTR